ncbi:MAG: TIGR01777 family oxidoreductase, partial [Alicycliphilus sp.]|nr:TIGR01777 family oxidoreductase [Alicycliphilus sp.]
MRILLTGGTGLIGRALCQHWQRQGHDLFVWSRDPAQVPRLCSGAQGIAQLQALDGSAPLDAVVNLAGAPIADRPWTAARRDLLWRSRVDLTRTLVDWMGRQAAPPRVLLSGSAVGWYGDRGEQWLAEDSAPGNADFGSRLCVAWEQEAERARQWGVRVALLRTAPVLAPQGGMLARLLPPFRLGLGGRLGSGQQWMPWIHLDDQVA